MFCVNVMITWVVIDKTHSQKRNNAWFMPPIDLFSFRELWFYWEMSWKLSTPYLSVVKNELLIGKGCPKSVLIPSIYLALQTKLFQLLDFVSEPFKNIQHLECIIIEAYNWLSKKRQLISPKFLNIRASHFYKNNITVLNCLFF